MSANPTARPENAVHRGLAGIIFDETEITDIQGQKGELRYRGYAIEELTIEPSFERTAFLLLNGEWPTVEEGDAFRADLAARRSLPADMIALLGHLAKATPDDALRTALSALDLGQHEGRAQMEIGLDLIAKVPSLIVAHHDLRSGREPTPPDPALDHASDILRRLLGRDLTAIEQETINLDFVLHADHGANASTFTARVAASTGVDMVAAMTAALAAFTGPLHGGAVAATSAMLAEIGSPEDVPSFVADRRRRSLPVYGFGHRVYRTRDPRSRPYYQALLTLSERAGDTGSIAILDALVEAMAPYRRMGIDVNVDLYATALYRLLGLPADLATAIFSAGRSIGWTTQILEQQANNILIRPRLRYAGPSARTLSSERTT
ncbi:MAG: citrate/2-methylcitrate synthase [Geminicoccaceae bacterium]